jgi:hypothetical protein
MCFGGKVEYTYMPKHIRKFLPLIPLLLLVLLTAWYFRFPLQASRLLRSFRKTSIQNSPAPQPQVTTVPTLPEPDLSTPVMLEVIEGSVQLQGATIASLSAGHQQQLAFDTTIVTGPKSLAILDYGQGTKVRLGPDSTIEYVDAEAASFIQWAGSVYVRFTKIIGVREDFSVETPTAVTTVRGTAWGQFVDPLTAETTVSVIESQVEVGQKDPLTGKWIESTAVRLDPDFETSVASPAAGFQDKPVVKLLARRRARAQTIRDRWLDFNQNLDAAEATDSASLRTVLKQKFLELYLRPGTSPVPTPKPSPSPLPALTSMPGVGLQRGSVRTATGSFPLSCIGAEKSTVRIITDSGNDSTCQNDCTVLPLHEYANRNGGFAAMNGSYFCPADYPACADKKNSFDTLFFNSRSRNYLNSDNNVYSVLPFLVINADGSPRFVNRTLEWGRDTGIQAGIAGHPLLVKDGQQVATADGLDSKQLTVKSNRGAFVQEGNTLYLCVVGSATVLDTAQVFSTLGADNAMNIDGGGSSALWLNGRYIYGPGRQIPNAIIFARR